MQFFDTTTKLGLCQDADFFAGTNTDNYPLADKARNANRWLAIVGVQVWQASNDWEFDDSNFSTLPWAVTDLVAGQEDYSLPTNIFKVEGVEVQDNEGNWSKVLPFDKRMLTQAYSEFYETDGLPRFYDVVGNSLVLKPAPAAASVTTSSGLKLYLSRSINNFTASDTATQPGFTTMFHSIISVGMAHDYALKTMNTEKVVLLKRTLYGDPSVRKDDWGMMGDLREYYGRRHRNFPQKLSPKRKSNI